MALVATGCTVESPTGAVPAPTARGFPQPPRDAHRARVNGVTDGDTISLAGVGRVRLIGIDTPEVYGASECYGAAASSFTKDVLAPGRTVTYEIGREAHDRYGRTLAYVWLGNGTLFNGLLAERGYATPLTIPPNDDYARLFLAAARRARAAHRGLWSSATCARDNRSSLAGGTRPTGGCGRFRTHAEAQAWWQRSGRPEGLDGDGDGSVCEDLP